MTRPLAIHAKTKSPICQVSQGKHLNKSGAFHFPQHEQHLFHIIFRCLSMSTSTSTSNIALSSRALAISNKGENHSNFKSCTVWYRKIQRLTTAVIKRSSCLAPTPALPLVTGTSTVKPYYFGKSFYCSFPFFFSPSQQHFPN
jgi:hypothetical protein